MLPGRGVPVTGMAASSSPAASHTDLEQRVHAFRQAHPCKDIEVDGVHWCYVIGGQGERTVLLPSGDARA